MSTLILNMQMACSNKTKSPNKKDFYQWLDAVFFRYKEDKEITIRIVDALESQILNFRYRGKNQPTNVLSFPFNPPSYIGLPFIGDLVICCSIVEQEAKEQNKELLEHWAHLVIHGSLHLLGYNHIQDSDAVEMQLIEKQLMLTLGYSDPYVIRSES
ncbi:MAG: rRNA maturation RNase YbeY [Candidatus Dasytiphilus stammeri]